MLPIAGYRHRYAREVERKPVGLYTLLHTVKTSETSVNIFTKMLKDVGMEVPKSIETRSKFSMHAGDDSMQQS